MATMTDIRHYSDNPNGNMTFAPRQPSMLGPGRADRPAQRGTVSMPTSPVLGGMRGGYSGEMGINPLWAQPPHSARSTFFDDAQRVMNGLSDQHDQDAPWHPNGHQSGDTGQAEHGMDHRDGVMDLNGQGHDQTRPDAYADQPSSAGPVRKKRAQVRIACTHCQKACKKCSNTRPCERCVRYGFEDCVDSTRKPRKTGIKRGPYKRRTSAKFEQFYSSSPDSYTHSQIHSASDQPPQPYGLAHDPYANAPPAHQSLGPGVSAIPPPPHRQNSGYVSPPDIIQPHQQHLLYPARPSYPSLGRAHPQHTYAQNQGRDLDNNPFTPPKTAELQGAFAQALAGPRWVHGQRTGGKHPISHAGEVLYPPTPSVPFPVSLHHRDDPFSRAVSPIHGDLEAALQGLKPRLSEAGPVSGDLGRGGVDEEAAFEFGTLPAREEMSMSEVDFRDPFVDLGQQQQQQQQQQEVYSAPTSPDQRPHSDFGTLFRSSSAEPPSHAPAPRFSASQLDHSPTHGGPYGFTGLPNYAHGPRHNAHRIESPAIIALKKIRKPSLRTLMSHGGSLAPSRQGSPVGDDPRGVHGMFGLEAIQSMSQSPTLFDQAMVMDEGFGDGVWEAFGQDQGREMVSGQRMGDEQGQKSGHELGQEMEEQGERELGQPEDRTRGLEGLSLLDLEMPFQT